MRIHPLRGQAFPVVWSQRDRNGRQLVCIELPNGEGRWLPIDWTDRGVPLTPLSVDGRESRASLRTLRLLAAAVDVMLQGTADCGTGERC